MDLIIILYLVYFLWRCVGCSMAWQIGQLCYTHYNNIHNVHLLPWAKPYSSSLNTIWTLVPNIKHDPSVQIGLCQQSPKSHVRESLTMSTFQSCSLHNRMSQNGYLLNGKLLKRGKFLRRTKFLFNAQNQREFTKVTVEFV